MRQSCPLSPVLFNTYINYLLFDFNKGNPDPVVINSSLADSCLVYADRILILVKSAVALQRMLDIVGSFRDTDIRT